MELSNKLIELLLNVDYLILTEQGRDIAPEHHPPKIKAAINNTCFWHNKI